MFVRKAIFFFIDVIDFPIIMKSMKRMVSHLKTLGFYTCCTKHLCIPTEICGFHANQYDFLMHTMMSIFFPMKSLYFLTKKWFIVQKRHLLYVLYSMLRFPPIKQLEHLIQSTKKMVFVNENEGAE